MPQIAESVFEAPACAVAPLAPDRRTARTRMALRRALAEEVRATGDLSRVTATSLSDRAGITRRTFYTHYHDVGELVDAIETELLDGLVLHLRAVANSNLDELHERIERREAAPGAEELLRYIADEGDMFQALLGSGGDPAFAARIEDTARAAVIERASQGLSFSSQSAPLDYYVSSVVCGLFGVVRRWVVTGMQESPKTMALALTMLSFIRPGDLYGKPLDFDIMAYAAALLESRLKEDDDV